MRKRQDDRAIAGRESDGGTLEVPRCYAGPRIPLPNSSWASSKMRKYMRVIGPLALATLLIACATAPVAYKTATPVSETNLLEGYSIYAEPKPGYSRVIVVRDSGMLGAASPAKLSIDGVAIAKFWSRERLELYLPPSTYIFGVEPSPRLMGAFVETTYEIKPGKSYGFRISLDGSGSFSFQQSTQLQ